MILDPNVDIKDPIKTTNTCNRLNKCNQCDYLSPHSNNLRKHMKGHSGEISNECSQCDYAFVSFTQFDDTYISYMSYMMAHNALYSYPLVNIARGTTDPGYKVYGLNYFSDQICINFSCKKKTEAPIFLYLLNKCKGNTTWLAVSWRIVSAGIKTEESNAGICAHSAYIPLHILTKLKHSETRSILHHLQVWSILIWKRRGGKAW